MKGLDVMSKSDRTQHHYADSWANQTTDYKICNSFDYYFFQYWGWCKYRYREADKKTFQDAKNSAILYFNACPAEVIRFINQSWHFRSTYQLGLTGRAAEWAVHKQKQHQSVSRAAMVALEYILVQ